MLRRWCCQADVTIEIEPVDPVLVKSGFATVDGADMVPVSTYRNGRRVYYLPGTSLKGVLRSHFERIARTLQPGSVCVPYYAKKGRRDAPPVDEELESYGCGFRRRSRDDIASVSYSDSCAACRLFGSLKFAGRFTIGDAYPIEGHLPQLNTRNGVGIDRFTGGTVPGVLFELQALVGGKFEAQIRLSNYELWQMGALWILLSDMADQMIGVGSGRSRGLGRVRAKVTAFHTAYLGNLSSLVGIGQLASEVEKRAYALHDWTPSDAVPLAGPGALQGVRRQYDVTDDWSDRLQPLVPALEAFLRWHGGPRGDIGGRGRQGDMS